jgi:hypothetical protein
MDDALRDTRRGIDAASAKWPIRGQTAIGRDLTPARARVADCSSALDKWSWFEPSDRDHAIELSPHRARPVVVLWLPRGSPTGNRRRVAVCRARRRCSECSSQLCLARCVQRARRLDCRVRRRSRVDHVQLGRAGWRLPDCRHVELPKRPRRRARRLYANV